MKIMSMDLAEKTRQQPRQGSLLRPRPIGRDRVVLLRARVYRCYSCLGRVLMICETFGSVVQLNVYVKSALWEAWCLAGAAIGDFRVQIGQLRTSPANTLQGSTRSDRGLRAGQGRRPRSAGVDSATAHRACSEDRRASPRRHCDPGALDLLVIVEYDRQIVTLIT